MTIEDLILKYQIKPTDRGTVRVHNVEAAKRDNIMPIVKERKPEILAFFAEQKAAEVAEAISAAKSAGAVVYTVLEWAHSYGMSIVSARRFYEHEKKGYSEWYRDHAFLAFDDSVNLVLSTSDPDPHFREIVLRPADGSFLSCSNQAWIITEEEKAYILALNDKRRAEKAAAERAKELRYWRGVVAKCEQQGKLYTRQEAAERARKYNDLFNEGGEGYVPKFWTIDEYETAKAYVAKLEGDQ